MQAKAVSHFVRTGKLGSSLTSAGKLALAFESAKTLASDRHLSHPLRSHACAKFTKAWAAATPEARLEGCGKRQEKVDEIAAWCKQPVKATVVSSEHSTLAYFVANSKAEAKVDTAAAVKALKGSERAQLRISTVRAAIRLVAKKGGDEKAFKEAASVAFPLAVWN